VVTFDWQGAAPLIEIDEQIRRELQPGPKRLHFIDLAAMVVLGHARVPTHS
jgi:hypothetical protein